MDQPTTAAYSSTRTRVTAVLVLTAALILAERAHPGWAHTASRKARCPSVPPVPLPQRAVRNGSATKTVLVTDGSNFDDLLTLLYLAKSPKFEPAAVFIAGNAWAHAAPSRRIMRDLLHLFGRYEHVPILLGAYFALDDVDQAASDGHAAAVIARYRAPVPPGMPGLVACDDAFGAARLLPPAPSSSDVEAPITDDASLTALATAMEHLPNRSVLMLVTGTLTPLALLLDQERGDREEQARNAAAASVILPRLRGVHVMGGAFHVPGNLFSLPGNARAEFNIYNDPHAAQIALHGLRAAKVPVTMVPLNATRFAPITRELVANLTDEALTPEAQWAGRVLDGVTSVMAGIGFDVYETVFLWDAVAAAVAGMPDVVRRRERMRARIVTDQGILGAEQGQTKACSEEEDTNGQCFDIDVVLEVDGALVSDLVLDVLQSGVNSAERGLAC